MLDKDIKKWMLLAKNIKDLENPCLSRSIGSIVVDPKTNSLVSSGHNGPSIDIKCDDEEYLRDVVWPQLTEEEQTISFSKMRNSLKYREWKKDANNHKDGNWFAPFFSKCGQCPRKIVGAQSGKRLELCVCSHSEANAVIKAHRSVCGFWIFCYCGVPCIDCCKTIIEGGIESVFCLERPQDYSPYSSRYMLSSAGINLIIKPEEYFA